MLREFREKKRLALIANIYVLGALTLALALSSFPAAAPARQFTSGGYSLAFGRSSVSVAADDLVLRIELAGGRSVSPLTEERPPVDSGGLARVTYPGVWDGVTVEYGKSAGAIVKSSYRVGAGSSPEAIRLRYNRPVRIEGNGDLVVAFEQGEMRESAPIAWQENQGSKTPVDVAFRLLSERDVGFRTGAYDRSRPLIIDPSLTWNTFLGGSGDDYGNGIAVDDSGNMYVTGYSKSSWQWQVGSSPVRSYSSNDDIFVAKLDANGGLVWYTFLGGSGNEYGKSVAVDGDGNVYVTGHGDATWGSPVSGRGYSADRDAFVAKLDSNGALLWNAFLGSSLGDYGEFIAVDGSGYAYVTGETYASWGSPIIRAKSADLDAFVTKLDANGGLIWNTFLGGDNVDYGMGIVVCGSDTIYVSGQSQSTWQGLLAPRRAFTSSSYDAFAAELDTNGNLAWNTFLGGSGGDFGRQIATDGPGNVYVAGLSDSSWGTPVNDYASGAYGVFAAKLDPNGDLAWNTFLGGAGDDQSSGIDADSSGNAYVTGYSSATWGSPLRAYASGQDAFAAKLDTNGGLTWHMFLGGNGSDSGAGIAVDGSRNAHVVGNSSATWASPLRAHYGSGQDAFVAKIPESPTLVELASFQGALEDGHVVLTWETASEIDNAGFHLWRAEPESPSVRITPALIPARGSTLEGAKYAFEDAAVGLGRVYFYRLEDIDTRGTSTFHGPVAVFVGFLTLLSPSDGFPVPPGFPPTFAWDIGLAAAGKIEFSIDPDFRTTMSSLPGGDAWTSETSYLPSKREWSGLRAVAGRPGIVYWRVRARILPEAEVVSRTRRLVLIR